MTLSTPPLLAAASSLTFESAMKAFAGFMWSEWFVWTLFATHLIMTLRTGFIQRHLLRAIKISFSREKEGEGDVSQFAALMTALAATIGTGNIVGVSAAIAVGGPGAVLWMWLTGVFGIATKYAEALLAVKYRVRQPDGTYAGGPMYALERGLGQRWLGLLFAIFTMIAAFGIGCMTQANSVVSHVVHSLPSMDPMTVKWSAGLLMAVITALVILGGVRSIARVCEFFVPIMAAGYVLGCIAILIHNHAALPGALKAIWDGAFGGTAAIGGFAGAVVSMAMQKGVARGLFSNESGLGSAPIVAAAAQTRNPVRQALVSATGTFWDTVVVCAMTGLVIVSSGHWTQGLNPTELTRAAFADLGTFGPPLLLFGLLTFVFSTILGWSYYGERAAEYVFGQRAIKPYRVLWVLAVLTGSVLSLDAVWDFSDGSNALMALPNIISLLLLHKVIAKETRDHAHEFSGKA